MSPRGRPRKLVEGVPPENSLEQEAIHDEEQLKCDHCPAHVSAETGIKKNGKWFCSESCAV